MTHIGAHVSAAGGVQETPLRAMAIGANALGLFTKNQRQWKASPLTEEQIDGFIRNLAAAEIPPGQVLPHDSYLINLGNPDPAKRKQSFESFLDEVRRAEQLQIPALNFHPGAHLKEVDEEACMQLVAGEMNRVLAETSGVTLVIEITAGQGSAIGYRFEHIARLIELSADPRRVGVCFDTCHAFAAGYDISTEEGYDRTFGEFDRIIGLPYLRAIHLNDAKVTLGSRVDRHHSIGMGNLGLDTFRRLMRDSRFDGFPFILETIDEELWATEIEMMRMLARGADIEVVGAMVGMKLSPEEA